MLLKIGELARRTGLTVRTLHHYDDIGLLLPSGRSEAGYRLYGPADIARLYQIQALRQLGLSLADIGASLASVGVALPQLLERQLQALDQQIAEAAALRDRLGRLQSQLRQGTEPPLADWLTTLEQMTMYDKYFTAQEQEELRQRQADPASQAAQAEWPTLVAAVQQMLATKVSPASDEAQALAQRWMGLVQQFIGNNLGLAPKLNTMYQQEASLQSQTGISPEIQAFVSQAATHSRLSIYARYLDDAEMARMRTHYGSATQKMSLGPLISQVRSLMTAGTPAHSAEAQALAQQWNTVTSAFAGNDPATRLKLRTAMRQEPGLLAGTGIDVAMLDFVRAALEAAQA